MQSQEDAMVTSSPWYLFYKCVPFILLYAWKMCASHPGKWGLPGKWQLCD